MKTAKDVQRAIRSLTELREKEFEDGSPASAALAYMIAGLSWVVGKRYRGIDARKIIGDQSGRK